MRILAWTLLPALRRGHAIKRLYEAVPSLPCSVCGCEISLGERLTRGKENQPVCQRCDPILSPERAELRPGR
jgi:hypothetical protein